MSLNVARSDGVTVLTLTSDPSSACPPLCQLLGALCYTPALCSTSRRLPPQRGGPQATLGALWIITGVLHIGLGSIILSTDGAPQYMLETTGCSPEWLGVLFMIIGVCCVLTERYPRPIAVLLSGFLNLTGAALSITSIVWHSYAFDHVGFYELCWSEEYDYYSSTPAALPVDKQVLLERCQEARLILRTFSIGLSVTLVTVSALDFCLGLSSAIISFKSLRQHGKESQGSEGTSQPLQEAKATLPEE